MYRQIGFGCLAPECNAFIVWKEVEPGQSAPTVRALKRAGGTCPAACTGSVTGICSVFPKGGRECRMIAQAGPHSTSVNTARNVPRAVLFGPKRCSVALA